MKQQMVMVVALALALAGSPALAASQDVPSDGRTFGDRVKILFGLGEDSAVAKREAPAQPAPTQQGQKPVQTFNDVEIEIDSLGGGLADGSGE